MKVISLIATFYMSLMINAQIRKEDKENWFIGEGKLRQKLISLKFAWVLKILMIQIELLNIYEVQFLVNQSLKFSKVRTQFSNEKKYIR